MLHQNSKRALLALTVGISLLSSAALAAGTATKTPASKPSAALTQPKVTDTPQARQTAAKAYLKVQPVEQLYQDTVIELSAQVPKEKRSEFLQLMAGAVDMPKLEQLALESLTKNFTASELTYMTQFYGSSTGKAIYEKFPAYLSDVGSGLKNVITLPEEKPSANGTAAPGNSSVAPSIAPEGNSPSMMKAAPKAPESTIKP